MRYSSLTPPLTPGAHARTQAVLPYHLPRGLAEGTDVVIEEIGHVSCVVKDDEGHTWNVPIVALDTGRMFWDSGRWVPEAH